MDEPVKARRKPYKKPGHKEVTTRMPVELADSLRDTALREEMTVTDFVIALTESAVRDDQLARTVARAFKRRTLEAALARLEDEDMPVSA